MLAAPARLSAVEDSGSPRGHDLCVRASSIDGVSILAVHGELDTFTAPRLAEAIEQGLATSTTGLVVDLSKLEFLASAGMSVLLNGHKSAQESGKRLIVVADGPATSRPMRLMGLDRELDLRASLDAALRDVR
jgi:anti-sigma B factor antagonist